MSGFSDYSAAAPMLGYFYQCRIALYESIVRLRRDPSMAVSIETLDDVVFEASGTPTEIIQVKHHIRRNANLTNQSEDLWKTILIWSDLFEKGLACESSARCLMTTSTSSQNSIAYYLGNEGRDTSKALELLHQSGCTSKNKTIQKAYEKFSCLPQDQQTCLIETAYVFDNRPLNNELTQRLLKEIWGFCSRKNAENFLDYLEGWWIRQVLSKLGSGSPNPISGSEIEAELTRLRDGFKADSLPIHPDILSADPEFSPFSNWIFAKQLRLIKIGDNRIKTAAKYFYKASTQRSRWVREDLLVDNDLNYYDGILKDEWRLRFDQHIDELSEPANEDESVKIGQAIYRWVESEANFPIKPSCQENFITRGSYHILSEQLTVGWHPDYERIMKDM